MTQLRDYEKDHHEILTEEATKLLEAHSKGQLEEELPDTVRIVSMCVFMLLIIMCYTYTVYIIIYIIYTNIIYIYYKYVFIIIYTMCVLLSFSYFQIKTLF